jgi:hypothetical protein
MTAAKDSSSSSARHVPIVDSLGTEWRRITIRADDLRAARAWGLPGSEVASLDEVLQRCGYRPAPTSVHQARSNTQRDQSHHDEYLILLLTIARDDRLAGRVVLQRILPALCALARRHSSTVHGQQDLIDDLVANSWASIRNYPVDRRTRRVVPNLVRDIGFQTIVRPARRRNAAELPPEHQHMIDTEYLSDTDPLQELVELLDEARRNGMSQQDIDFICQIVTFDQPDRVAAILEVTPRTVRNHRDAIVHRLRHIAAVAA